MLLLSKVLDVLAFAKKVGLAYLVIRKMVDCPVVLLVN